VVKNYTYRPDGKISGFQSGNLSVSYFYDGLDRLIAKLINENGTTYTQSFTHLGNSNRILLGKAGDGSVTTYIDGKGASERLGEVKNGVGKGYITDHLGSVLNSAVAGSSKAYGLFGEIFANPKISQTANPVVYGFTGHMIDLESGLNRTEFRQYDSKIGRWLSQEPAGLDGPNPYWYVKNRPLVMIDPNGLEGGFPGGSCQMFGGICEHFPEVVDETAKNVAYTYAAIGVGVCGGPVAASAARACAANPQLCLAFAQGVASGLSGHSPGPPSPTDLEREAYKYIGKEFGKIIRNANE
jgi:RHS repeat-associated protein